VRTDPQHSKLRDGRLQASVRRYYRTVAPFIDAELEDRGDEELWLAIGHQHRGGDILELGCGSGRVTRLLAQSEARVAGVDVSPELLAIARRRVAADRVWLLLADMRQLAFRCRFDAIVAPDDPFSHLTSDADRARVLAGVAGHLAPTGRFVLDALWFPADEERRGASAEGRVVEHDLDLEGRRVHVTERWRCDARTHRCTTEYGYDSGSDEPARATFRSRYWTLAELGQGLAAAGLRMTAAWGGYDRRSWDEQRSEHLVVEAKRA
jgi:SAM-dependent methyltransferase